MDVFIHNKFLYVKSYCNSFALNIFRELGEPEKAEGFLIDSMKMYKRERWYDLSDHSRMKLAQCQKEMKCPRYVNLN